MSFISIINSFFILVYVIYMVRIINQFGSHIFPLLYLIVILTWILSSVYALDFGGVYIFELRLTSTQSFATSGLVVCNIFFFEGIFSYLRSSNYLEIPSNLEGLSTPREIQLLDILNNLLILLLFSSFYFTGIPLLSGMDRAEYWELVSGIPGLNVVMGNYLLISFLVGLGFGLKRYYGKKGYWSIVQISTIIIFFILAGNKFSALFAILTNFLISPTFLGAFKSVSFKRLIKYALLALTFFFVTVLIQSNTYSLSSDAYGKYKIFSYLFQRVFVLQGEIWWKTFQDVIVGSQFDPSHFLVEVKAIFNNDQNSFTGLKYLMVKSANGNFIYEILKGNYLYTGAFPAIIIATFPKVLVLPVLFVLGRLLAILLMFFKKLHFQRSYIRLYLVFVLLSTYLSMILGGAFSKFFMFGNLIRICILIGFALLIYNHIKLSTTSYRNEE